MVAVYQCCKNISHVLYNGIEAESTTFWLKIHHWVHWPNSNLTLPSLPIVRPSSVMVVAVPQLMMAYSGPGPLHQYLYVHDTVDGKGAITK